MRWISEPPRTRRDDPRIKAGLRAAAFARAGGADGLRGLGVTLMGNGEFREAISAFELSRRAGAAAFSEWRHLAAAYFAVGRYEDVLSTCDAAAPNVRGLVELRARALERLGGEDASCDAYIRSLHDGASPSTLYQTLALLTRRGEIARMLDVCAALPDRLRDTPPVLAFRAIALSFAGDEEGARRLIDPERHVARVRFEPPATSGGLERFNDRLADAIRTASPSVETRDGFTLQHSPRLGDSEEFAALCGFVRTEMERYIDEMPSRGLSDVMPAAPIGGILHAASVILTHDGSNGEHLHADGYLSAVYHVRVPAELSGANDQRGALAVGACESIAHDHVPCWKTRYITPEAGWLTIMPSHVFHDVVPTGIDSPRISLAFDLQPVAVK